MRVREIWRYPVESMTGERLEVGNVGRAMTLHAQADLPRDACVLRTIVRQANQCLGLSASVVQAGRIRTGGPLEAVDAAATAT